MEIVSTAVFVQDDKIDQFKIYSSDSPLGFLY